MEQEQIEQRKLANQFARRALRVIKAEIYAQASVTIQRQISAKRRDRNSMSRWEMD